MSDSQQSLSFPGKLRQVVTQDLPFYQAILAYLVGVSVFALATGHFEHLIFSMYNETLLISLLLLFFLYLAALPFLMMWRREARPIGAIVGHLKGQWQGRHKLAGVLLLMAGISLFKSNFTSQKALIPFYTDFSWDQTFAELDRWLHGGIDPWQLTHAWFDTPFATGVLAFLYNLWFFLYWGMLIIFMFRFSAPGDRLQYLLTQVVTWVVLGTLMALAFASAGPCYYGDITGDQVYYAELMSRLSEQDQALRSGDGFLRVWALDTQAFLWQAYDGRTSVFGGGISAFPSLHVAIAVIMAIGAWRLNRIFGALMWVFVIAIQIGSVHLAWHYAVDGYVAIILTPIIWWACGRWVTWWQSRGNPFDEPA